MAEQTYIEQIKVAGEELLEEFERLLHEGNVRRIVIKQNEQTVVEFPLTVGVIGVVLAPMLAAVGAMAALLTSCTIEVERTGEPAPPPGDREPVATVKSGSYTIGEPLSPR